VKRWIDLFLGSLAAIAVALLLALIARDEVGMSLEMVRQDALVGAGILSGALFSLSGRNPRPKF
jgi:hypothetical protein